MLCWSKLFKSRLCHHYSIYSLVAFRPSCVCCFCCCKCCGLAVVFLQSSYTFPSKCRCSSPFENLVSHSLLTSQLYSFSCLSCGNVICGTSYLCSLNCVPCGIVIYGNSVVCLAACTTIGITDSFILPLIIFCALRFLLSYSLFIFEPKAPPSTLFFLFRALLRKCVATSFLFSSVVHISSLVFKTLVGGLCGFSFSCINRYSKIFANC